MEITIPYLTPLRNRTYRYTANYASFGEPLMGDTWITDITHFEGVDAPGSNAPAAARRMAQYLREIVKAASFANAIFIPVQTEIRCRRRPGRKPCPGIISVFIDTADSAIHWGCSHCDDNGVIRNWKGTEWDLSQ